MHNMQLHYHYLHHLDHHLNDFESVFTKKNPPKLRDACIRQTCQANTSQVKWILEEWWKLPPYWVLYNQLLPPWWHRWAAWQKGNTRGVVDVHYGETFWLWYLGIPQALSASEMPQLFTGRWKQFFIERVTDWYHLESIGFSIIIYNHKNESYIIYSLYILILWRYRPTVVRHCANNHVCKDVFWDVFFDQVPSPIWVRKLFVFSSFGTCLMLGAVRVTKHEVRISEWLCVRSYILNSII